ncbi:hypothetical protein EP51_43715 (plasmid) [Rhodococcus opacus]|uniref:Uncharacterized protein n=1 Tax=Rhodococcus opacus TaxID=37919 RepID=A0A076EYZ5_RHOOP|nr:hypothetical protein EP51_43715 [Rhodococcus opacus]
MWAGGVSGRAAVTGQFPATVLFAVSRTAAMVRIAPVLISPRRSMMGASGRFSVIRGKIRRPRRRRQDRQLVDLGQLLGMPRLVVDEQDGGVVVGQLFVAPDDRPR